MTDWEKAISKWLPEVWQPKTRCYSVFNCPHTKFKSVGPGNRQVIEPHDIPCPPATRDLGFRLLEAMLAKRPQDIVLHMFLDDDKRLLYAVRIGWITDDFSDPDILTAITKAAASLALEE